MVGRRREVLALHPFLLRPWWMKNLEGAGNFQLEKGTLFGLGAREDVIRGPGLSLGLGQRQVDPLGGPLCSSLAEPWLRAAAGRRGEEHRPIVCDPCLPPRQQC